MKWTYRAFNRMGYQIVMDAKPDFTVYVESDNNTISWILENTSGKKTFFSVYDLFRNLKE